MFWIVTQRCHWGGSLGVASSRNISAPPQSVWDAITDIDSSPAVLSTVESVERLDGSELGDAILVGTRWKETRHVKGRKEYAVEMGVTAIDDDETEFPRAVSITSKSPSGNATATLRVEPRMGHSRLTVTFAISPSGFFVKLFAATCGCFINKRALKHVQADMDDIAAACGDRRRISGMKMSDLSSLREDDLPKDLES